MLNLNTFKSNTKLTILPTLCDTGKLEWNKYTVATVTYNYTNPRCWK